MLALPGNVAVGVEGRRQSAPVARFFAVDTVEEAEGAESEDGEE